MVMVSAPGVVLAWSTAARRLPAPLSALVVTVRIGGSKVALRLLAAVMVKAQGLASDQPTVAVAVRDTAVPWSRVAVQVPEGVPAVSVQLSLFPVTVPLPLPPPVTVKAYWGGTVRVKVRVAVCPRASVAVMVTLEVPDWVGVPLMVRVPSLLSVAVRPAGNPVALRVRRQTGRRGWSG